MANAEVLNKIPCGGFENENDGCQEIFPRGSGLCQKCRKLTSPSLSDADRQDITKNYVTCAGCGLSGRTISTFCGTCRRLEAEGKGEEDPVKAAAAAERLARAQRSFGTGGPPKLFDLTNHKQGPTTSVSELDTIRTSALKGFWTVVFVARRKGTIDKSLGTGTLTFSPDTTMIDVLVGLVEQINVQWVKSDGHVMDLRAEDCDLRFSGNTVFAMGTETLTIKNFYAYYINRPEKALVLIQDAKLKLPKGTSLNLEVLINEDAYYKRTGCVEDDEDDEDDVYGKILRKGGKRKGGKLTTFQPPKKARGASSNVDRPLTTKFRNDQDYTLLDNAVVKSDSITFSTITCTINGEDGSPYLVESSDQKQGKIDCAALKLHPGYQGKSKDVYNLHIGADHFIAKTFFDLGKGRGKDLSMNQVLLIRDLIRLKRLATFRQSFVMKAQTSSVEVADFSVSEAFVMTIDTRIGESADTTNMVYLVEPLRSSAAVTKFSGTLGTTNKTDKMSATISAFAHFVIADTACSYVFADLQGSLHHAPHTRKELVLFDPMTHSLYGQSGLGDFGVEGLQNFIDSHKCSVICQNLKLPKISVLQLTLDAKIAERDGVMEKRLQDGLVLEDGEAIPQVEDDTFTIHRAPPLDN